MSVKIEVTIAHRNEIGQVVKEEELDELFQTVYDIGAWNELINAVNDIILSSNLDMFKDDMRINRWLKAVMKLDPEKRNEYMEYILRNI
jgi:hypothetical protein